MAEVTAIGWTDHTFNPWMGCSKVSPACDHCYAESLGKRTGKVQWGDDAVRVVTGDDYWRNPLKWNAKAEAEGVRRRVFCASMADVFEGRDELDDIRRRLWDLIDATPSLDWQLLTKRPQNVPAMVPARWLFSWPSNAWMGVTIEDQARCDERLPYLVHLPAPVRFVSHEPALGPIDLRGYLGDEWHRSQQHTLARPGHVVAVDVDDQSLRLACDSCSWSTDMLGVSWVIAGGESGPGHRPLDLDPIRALRDDCAAARVPFFFKQHGGRTPTAGGRDLDGRTWDGFPA